LHLSILEILDNQNAKWTPKIKTGSGSMMASNFLRGPKGSFHKEEEGRSALTINKMHPMYILVMYLM
jgi:hypothetical protein